MTHGETTEYMSRNGSSASQEPDHPGGGPDREKNDLIGPSIVERQPAPS
jgi:hypothetical protein